MELEISRHYATAYETIVRALDEFLAPYKLANGSIDFELLRLDMAVKHTLNHTIARHQKLLSLIDKISEDLGKQEILTLENLLMDTYKTNYYENLYRIEKSMRYKMDFSLLSQQRLKQVIHTKWAKDGREFSSRIWRDKRHLNREVRRLINDSIATGKSPLQTAQALQQTTQNTLYNCKRLARTETCAILSESDNASYAEAGITKYQILSTFDAKTSDICQKQDGKIYETDKQTIGTNAPPFHPNCRTTTTPYFEVAEELRFARDFKGNKVRVPRNMTYQEFKRAHSIV